MNIKIPSNWKIIDKKDYNKYAVLNNGFLICEGAYLREENVNQVITVYRYENAEDNVLNEIKAGIIRNEKENELIDGLKTDENFEDTSVSSLIWSEDLVSDGRGSYAHISKVFNDSEKYVNVFQIYFWKDNEFYSAQCKLGEMLTETIEEYISKNPVVVEIMRCIKNS